MVPEPAKKSRTIALGDVTTAEDSKNFTKVDGFGKAKGLIAKILAISAVPWAVLNKSDVIRFDTVHNFV